MKSHITIAVVLGAFASYAAAQTPTTKPSDPAPATATATSPAATAPATAPATQEAVVFGILKNLETAGNKYLTIKADIVDSTFKAGMGLPPEVRTGYVIYQKQTKDKQWAFRIHYETLKQGEGKAIRDLMDYAFMAEKPGSNTGSVLCIAEHANKVLRRIQVAAPGKEIEPMTLGKGPFPLPFGQKAGDVLERFDVTTRPLQPGEPPNTVYLRMVPKPKYKQDVNFVELQMWIDKGLNLPIKLISRDTTKPPLVTTVTFGMDKDGKVKIEFNKDVPQNEFMLERPRDWKLVTTSLEKETQ